MIIHWHNFQGFQLFFSFESKCFSMGRGEHGAKWEKWGNIFYVSGKPKYLCENDAILQAQRKCHLMASSLISSTKIATQSFILSEPAFTRKSQ